MMPNDTALNVICLHAFSAFNAFSGFIITASSPQQQGRDGLGKFSKRAKKEFNLLALVTQTQRRL